MDIITLRAGFTVLMFVMFLAIVIWAWSDRRKQAFRDAANLPFADESAPARDAEQRHE